MFFEKRYPRWLDEDRIYNLKKQGSALKGEVAEVIVKNRVNYAHRPREISPSFLDELKFDIPKKVKSYLKKYWYTVDIFSFKLDKQSKEFMNLEVYEVKSRNMYDPSFKKRFFKPPITRNSLKAYKEAIKLGFIVKYVEVIFLDSWDYYIFFKDFNPEYFVVHDGGNPQFSKVKT